MDAQTIAQLKNHIMGIARILHAEANLTDLKTLETCLWIVQRQEWPEVNRCEPIEEMALYGGMVRLRTGEGEGSQWREYKALKVNNQVKLPYFKDNEGLLLYKT